jgi:pimeloyl-ACP methyl ester carboxylesterase
VSADNLSRSFDGLHVDVHDGDGPPALLVHGVMAGRALWTENLAALAQVCRPVVLELHGHGRSSSPDDPAAYAPARYVAAFDALRRELGAPRWFVLGHSLGAALVLRYAADHPDRVIAAAFTNSASAFASDRWRERVEASAPAEAARLVAAGREGIRESRINPARVRHVVPAVRAALAADEHLLDPDGIGRTIVHTLPGTSMRDRIAHNRVPTLLVSGDREAAFDDGRDHAATAPHVEVQRVDAGHSPNAEAPAVYNAAVVAFLARHAASAR